MIHGDRVRSEPSCSCRCEYRSIIACDNTPDIWSRCGPLCILCIHNECSIGALWSEKGSIIDQEKGTLTTGLPLFHGCLSPFLPLFKSLQSNQLGENFMVSWHRIWKSCSLVSWLSIKEEIACLYAIGRLLQEFVLVVDIWCWCVAALKGCPWVNFHYLVLLTSSFGLFNVKLCYQMCCLGIIALSSVTLMVLKSSCDIWMA